MAARPPRVAHRSGDDPPAGMTTAAPSGSRGFFGFRLAAPVLACALLAATGCRRSTLPPELPDGEFWRLATGLSEPPGNFTHSDNLVSNESLFADTMRTLRSSGGAYVGVGPEQNFSYIAAIKPNIAFIVDIRAENRSLQLLYKALFELSADRADFISRLFSRERPAGIGSETLVEDLFAKYAAMAPQRRLREENGKLVRQRLLDVHRFTLEPRDLEWIEYALDAFYSDGPDIHYARLLPHDPRGPSYRTLMIAADVTRTSRSYLATEESFRVVKELQSRNLIVPVIGDFGGSTALRRTGDYLRQHRQTLSAFYGSNVEVYLNREKAAAFCVNLARLPFNWNTYFIGSKAKQPLRLKVAACRAALPPAGDAPGSQ
jgi:hypothetical protein